MVGFDISEGELDAIVEIAGTLDRIAAKLEQRGMDPNRARTVGTFYMAIKNLVEQREENDEIRVEMRRASFDLRQDMQRVFNEMHKVDTLIEAVQMLIAEDRKLITLIGGNMQAEWEALSTERKKKEEVLINAGLRKPNNNTR